MKIVIGTANFLRKYTYKKQAVEKREIIKILNFARLNKISSIDTAFEYDRFNTVTKKINLNKFSISTKINFIKRDIYKKKFIQNYVKIVQKKVRLFKIKKFENLLIHNFDQLDSHDLKVLEPLFLRLKSKRLINNVGVSVYDTRALKKIRNFNFVNLVQAPINLFDRRFTEKKILHFLKKRKIKLQARSIFLQGKLLDNLKKAPYKKNKIFRDYNYWLSEKNRQPVKTCLDYIRSETSINSMVVGINNIKQLKEIIKFSKKKNKIDFPSKIFTFNKKIIDPRKW